MNSSAKTLIYQARSWSNYRDYFNTVENSRKTAWLNLNKDEYYYIEARSVDFGGASHLTVSVEIDDPNAVQSHFHTMREIQRLFIYQDVVREKMNITISNPDGG